MDKEGNYIADRIRSLLDNAIRLRKARLNNDFENIPHFESWVRKSMVQLLDFLGGYIYFIRNSETSSDYPPCPCLFCKNFEFDKSGNSVCSIGKPLNKEIMNEIALMGCAQFDSKVDNIDNKIQESRELLKLFWKETDHIDIFLIIMQFMKEEISKLINIKEGAE